MRPSCAGLILIVAAGFAPAQQCTAAWSDAFALPGFQAAARKICGYDPGTGARLFAGGFLAAIAGVNGPTAPVAQWDGVLWSPLPLIPSNFSTEGSAFAVFDDGTGPALYVGFLGSFQLTDGTPINGIARWNGTAWSTLGAGVNGAVRALEVFDDGSGPALYAGGTFTASGGTSLNRVGRWNGSSWSALGGGVPLGEVLALRAWTGGGGAGLYAMGSFAIAGGVAAANVARWNGSSWTALGPGLPGTARDAWPYDDGSGPALYVTGAFPVTSWNGTAWTQAGATAPSGGFGLAVFDEGAGPALFACGDLPNAIARYSGGVWSSVGTLLANGGRALAVFDDGTGPALYLVGIVVGHPALQIARWNGSTWSALPGYGADGGALAFVSADPAAGLPMVVAGNFSTIGGIEAYNVAAFADGNWSPLGSAYELSGFVRAAARFDDGTGLALYAAGRFFSGGVPSGHIARWNGMAWTDLSGGVAGGVAGAMTEIRAMAVFDDGAGPRLVCGGNFSTAGGVTAHAIATWDGASWAPMNGLPGAVVRALLVADFGAGPRLYAGGSVPGAGLGFVAQRIPGGWQVLGTSTGLPGCNALAAFDDGTGPALYAAGTFSTMNGAAASNVMRLAGYWTQASPMIPAGRGGVEALAVFDDGGGPGLYAIGNPLFTAPGTNLARMAGPGVWIPVGGDVAFGTNLCGGSTIAAIDDGSGPALYVGGCLTSAGGIASSGIAKWGPPRPAITVTQPGGAGAPVQVRDTWLVEGREYYNVFSDSLCGAVGAGPYLGLCATNPALLLLQVNLPVGAVPIHFLASAGTMTSGGHQLPPGLALDAVCFDYTGAVLNCASRVARIIVQ